MKEHYDTRSEPYCHNRRASEWVSLGWYFQQEHCASIYQWRAATPQKRQGRRRHLLHLFSHNFWQRFTYSLMTLLYMIFYAIIKAHAAMHAKYNYYRARRQPQALPAHFMQYPKFSALVSITTFPIQGAKYSLFHYRKMMSEREESDEVTASKINTYIAH